jgi:hypothetical protein
MVRMPAVPEKKPISAMPSTEPTRAGLSGRVARSPTERKLAVVGSPLNRNSTVVPSGAGLPSLVTTAWTITGWPRKGPESLELIEVMAQAAGTTVGTGGAEGLSPEQAVRSANPKSAMETMDLFMAADPLTVTDYRRRS